MSDLKPFLFDFDGRTYELPDVRVLSARQLRAASRGDFDALEAALRANGADPEAVDALMDMPIHRLDGVIEDWVSGDGGKLPEPSRSSNTTGTRSKRTSRSAGSRSTR